MAAPKAMRSHIGAAMRSVVADRRRGRPSRRSNSEDDRTPGPLYVMETNRHFTCAESVPALSAPSPNRRPEFGRHRSWPKPFDQISSWSVFRTLYGKMVSACDPCSIVVRPMPAQVDLEASPGKALRRLEVGESVVAQQLRASDRTSSRAFTMGLSPQFLRCTGNP